MNMYEFVFKAHKITLQQPAVSSRNKNVDIAIAFEMNLIFDQ